MNSSWLPWTQEIAVTMGTLQVTLEQLDSIMLL